MCWLTLIDSLCIVRIKVSNFPPRERDVQQPRVIAFIGEIGAGKSTAARYVENRHRYRRLPFAAPLKAMLLVLGLNDSHVNGDLKEVPLPLLCGKSPRKAMQTLGNEWGRDLIGADLWANVWSQEADYRLKAGNSIVVDDARYNNEFSAIRQRGGVIIRVVRPGERSEHTDHPSERDQRAIRADLTLSNDGSIADLLSKVDAAIELMRNEVSVESGVSTAAE